MCFRSWRELKPKSELSTYKHRQYSTQNLSLARAEPFRLPFRFWTLLTAAIVYVISYSGYCRNWFKIVFMCDHVIHWNFYQLRLLELGYAIFWKDQLTYLILIGWYRFADPLALNLYYWCKEMVALTTEFNVNAIAKCEILERNVHCHPLCGP